MIRNKIRNNKSKKSNRKCKKRQIKIIRSNPLNQTQMNSQYVVIWCAII